MSKVNHKAVFVLLSKYIRRRKTCERILGRPLRARDNLMKFCCHGGQMPAEMARRMLELVNAGVSRPPILSTCRRSASRPSAVVAISSFKRHFDSLCTTVFRRQSFFQRQFSRRLPTVCQQSSETFSFNFRVATVTAPKPLPPMCKNTASPCKDKCNCYIVPCNPAQPAETNVHISSPLRHIMHCQDYRRVQAGLNCAW